MHRSVQLNEDNGRAGNIDPCQSNRPGASFVAAANPAAAAHISLLSLAVSGFVLLCIPPCLFYHSPPPFVLSISEGFNSGGGREQGGCNLKPPSIN